MLLKHEIRLSLGFLGTINNCGKSDDEIISMFKNITPSKGDTNDYVTIRYNFENGNFHKITRDFESFFIIPVNDLVYVYKTIPAIEDDYLFHWKERHNRNGKQWNALIEKGIIRISVCVNSNGSTSVRIYGKANDNGDYDHFNLPAFSDNKEILTAIREHLDTLKEKINDVSI